MEKFKDWLLINGKSYLTARNYIGRINKVLSKIKEEDFSSETLTTFLRELQQQNNSAETVNAYHVALQTYLKFLKKTNQ
jgi:site-specific recombinase XerD